MLGVDPLDVEEQAEALRTALGLDRDERERRGAAIRERVRTHDLDAWAERELDELARRDDPGRARRLSAGYDPRVNARHSTLLSSCCRNGQQRGDVRVSELSHVDEATGEVRMVDVGGKPLSRRRAVARGRVGMALGDRGAAAHAAEGRRARRRPDRGDPGREADERPDPALSSRCH